MIAAICTIVLLTQTGFANLPHLLANHPLYGVLATYDREIAALRATQEVSHASFAPAQVQAAGVALQRNAAAAARQAQTVASNGSSALAVALNRRSEQYDAALTTETNANLRAFDAATAQRIARGVEARRQQLREKELTIAYDLARKEAGERLTLRLRLEDLHLRPAAKKASSARLAALDRGDAATLDAARRSDAAILVAYESTLAANAGGVNAQVSEQLHDAALANHSANASVRDSIATAARSFRSVHRVGDDARALAANFQSTAAALPPEFARLAAERRSADAATGAQINVLEKDRSDLYRAILAQIDRAVQGVGRTKHLERVTLGSKAPHGAVDVTKIVILSEATLSERSE